MRVAFLVPFLWACHNDVHDSSGSRPNDDSQAPSDDSSTVPTDDTSEQVEACEELEIEFEGPPQPRVGDSWTLQLFCDGALMLNTILRFDPPEFASVDDMTATFLYAGTATLRMQAGTTREYLEVTVTD
jgi:hypothetical protein